MFASITWIHRAKGCLATMQYGLQTYVATLLTGHSVKHMMMHTRSTFVRFRKTSVPYFAVVNMQASAMHIMTGPKMLGRSLGSDVLFAGHEGSPVMCWWPIQLHFDAEGLGGSSAHQPPRPILPPHVNVSGSLSVISKPTRAWGGILHTLATESVGVRSLRRLKTSVHVCSPWVSWLHAQFCTLFSLIFYGTTSMHTFVMTCIVFSHYMHVVHLCHGGWRMPRGTGTGISSSWPLTSGPVLGKYVDYGTHASVWSISMANGARG
jgi:hypothetical protein